MTHYRLGLALQEIGALRQGAIDQYRLALSIDDALAPTHNNLGLLLLKRRLFEEARRHYVRAIELNPDLVDAHVNLAFLCLTVRDYPQAIAEARRAGAEAKIADCLPRVYRPGVAGRGACG